MTNRLSRAKSRHTCTPRNRPSEIRPRYGKVLIESVRPQGVMTL